MLDSIFMRQAVLQKESFGLDPENLPEEEKIQFIKDMILAATDELHEALGEVGWNHGQRHVILTVKPLLVNWLMYFTSL